MAARLHTKTDLKAVFSIHLNEVPAKGLCKLAKFGHVATDFSMKTKVQRVVDPITVNNGEIEICILAGGLSSRMGHNKANLRIRGRTFLSRIRETAGELNLPVRVIRRDLVPRCGPIGGIYTAFKQSRVDTLMFLACDMPAISESLLRKLLKRFSSRTKALFTWHDSGAGFPFILNRETLPVIERLLESKKYSLQNLAQKMEAKKFKVPRAYRAELLNINTPKDLEILRTCRKS